MSLQNPDTSIPTLPLTSANNYKFKFVGEGAANIVFEVITEPQDENRSIFQDYLLRVPKAGTKAHKYVELQEYWETAVKGLFRPEDLVQQRLIRLEGEELASRLNHVLDQEEESRRADYRGSRVAAVEYGMLVEDMRKRNPDDLTLEFKPKWLAQSPNAPASATRCRNCARELLRHERTKPNDRLDDKSQKPKTTILCPLNFLACPTSPPALADVLAYLATALDPPIRRVETTPPAQYDRLVHWLRTNDLIPRLRAAQLAHDGDGAGPLGAAAAARDPAAAASLQLAMTLRDCACFVRVPTDPGAPVEAKLGDLDKKNWVAKLGYWQGMETKLIEGRYYEGREVDGVEVNCQL
ncbi:hypothetical protein VTI28DRAFT_4281 [Corynascus sepedonium]